MPFSARQGFFKLAVSDDIVWYEYDRANYEPISESLTGGGVANSTFSVSPMTTSLAYRGGVAHPNGNIYCVPRNSGDGLLEIDPNSEANSTYTYGDLSLLSATGQAYFHSCCLTESGNILAVPFNYDYIMQIDPVAQTATKFGLTGRDSGPFTSSVQFTGAVLAPNGNVIAIPQQYGDFLDIDPVNETVTVTDFGLTLRSGTNEFFGGCRSFQDNKIYPSPLRYQGIVAIDTDAKTATTSQYSQSWPGVNNHYGTSCDKFGRIIYVGGENTVPHRIFDPDSNTASTFTGSPTLTGFSYGSIQGADGNVYTISKGSATRKIIFTSNTDVSPTINTVQSDTNNKMIAAGTTDGEIIILRDGGNATAFKLNLNTSPDIDNFANVVMTPYMNAGRI